MKTVMMFLALAASVHPDELTLKDGSRIEWSSIKRVGDSFEVETTDGKRLTVKEADVAGINLTRPRPKAGEAPLTGASFIMNRKRKGVVQLLQTVDVRRDVVLGQWKPSRTGITAVHEGSANAKIQFTAVAVPEEYDLSMTLERKSGAGDFVIGLVRSGKQFELAIDAYKCTVTGLVMVDGLKDLDATMKGPTLPLGSLRQLLVMVRKEGIVFRIDGKDAITWSGDWQRLVVPDVHAVPSKNCLFFVCCNGTYEVTAATLTVLGE